jgi:hypothetical protein
MRAGVREANKNERALIRLIKPFLFSFTEPQFYNNKTTVIKFIQT